MALDTAFYLVTRDIAIRSGLVDVRYRTHDGRFILDNKDLSRVRFTTDEYVSGLAGVEKITESEAQTLIAKGGYKKGLMADSSPTTNGFANEAPIVEETNDEQEVVEEPNEGANVESNEVEGTSEEPTENVEAEEQASDNNEEETENNEQEKEEE
jgi:hypothetical protein